MSCFARFVSISKAVLFVPVALLLACSLAMAGIFADYDFIDLKMTPAMREDCHIVRFPNGWRIRGVDVNGSRIEIDNANSDFEFRVEGPLETWFLVGAFQTWGRAANHYRVNLSDPAAPVLAAREQDWDAATPLPFVHKPVPPFDFYDKYPIKFNGFQFMRSGAHWSISPARLSPDSAWLILQSETNVTTSPYKYVYRVFFDVFNADTGRKAFTIEAKYQGVSVPDVCLRTTAWLTERYFIIALGKHRERCLVCDFGARRKQADKP